MFEFLRGPKPPAEATAQGPPAGSPIHIQIKGLHKSFGVRGEYKILSGVDLKLYRGKINIIIGGSGSGKSVLLKHVIALIKPDAGSIFIDGVNIVGKTEFELQPIRKKFGMLFQYSALFDSMSVHDNIAFPMREHTTLTKKDIRERVFARLKTLKLEDSIDKFPAELSGGMKKRAALARALALNPEIIIFDEPTSGLDPVLAREIDNLIVETIEQEKATGLIISHDMASSFRIGDYVSMLSEGKIVASGTNKEMIDSQEPAIRQFIDLSGVTLTSE